MVLFSVPWLFLMVSIFFWIYCIFVCLLWNSYFKLFMFLCYRVVEGPYFHYCLSLCHNCHQHSLHPALPRLMCWSLDPLLLALWGGCANFNWLETGGKELGHRRCTIEGDMGSHSLSTLFFASLLPSSKFSFATFALP